MLSGISTLTVTAPEQASAAPRSAVAADDPGTQATADQVEAMRQAHLSGRPVEVVSQRTETSQTFANPDGTLTSENTPRAARVH
ncbi:MAG: hypothetical protein WCA46_00485, partial [Actinocatenispora sp.]